jgi:cold shock CspA family protein
MKPMDGGEEIFCHVSVITADGNMLREGDMVEYEQEYDDRKGRYRAVEVTGGRREEERRDDRRGVVGCDPALARCWRPLARMNMLLPVLLLFAASAQTCAGASAPIVGTWIRSTAASDAGKFRLIGCKNPAKAGQSAQTLSVSTTFSETKLLNGDAVSAPKHALWGVAGKTIPMFVRPMGEEKVSDKIGAPEFRNGRDVVINPKDIECELALVLSLLACCWMLVQTRLGAGARGRATWGFWTGIVLVVLSCLPAGQAAKPRPQMTLPYFPWRHGLPSTRNTHAMAAAGDDSVWLHGGETAEGFSDQLFKLDP